MTETTLDLRGEPEQAAGYPPAPGATPGIPTLTKGGRRIGSGRPVSTEPSPLQRDLIVIALGDPNASRHSLAQELGCSIETIRYHLSAIAAKRWLPQSVLDGIHSRQLSPGRPRGCNRRPYTRQKMRLQQQPSSWADKIVALLRTDIHAVDRFVRMFSGDPS